MNKRISSASYAIALMNVMGGAALVTSCKEKSGLQQPASVAVLQTPALTSLD